MTTLQRHRNRSLIITHGMHDCAMNFRMKILLWNFRFFRLCLMGNAWQCNGSQGNSDPTLRRTAGDAKPPPREVGTSLGQVPFTTVDG